MALNWSPPIPLSRREEAIVEHCKKAPLFVFLRQVRHELFDAATQARLATMYPARTAGADPVAPARQALVFLLQRALGTSDQEAVRLAATDRCWQMVLDTLDDDAPPVSQGALVAFRVRLVAHDADGWLFDRVVALARATRLFSATARRVAFDAAPLRGAGRVEDTFNLLGHAARTIVATLAERLGVPFDEAARQVGVPLLTAPSVKAGLDVDWSDPTQHHAALTALLTQLDALREYLHAHRAEALTAAPVPAQTQTLERLAVQDLEVTPAAQAPAVTPTAADCRLQDGVAPDRQISVTDPAMRHGRKSKAVRFDGYRRHLASDLDTDLVVGVAVTPGNRPEGEAAGDLAADLTRQGFTVTTLAIDLAYEGSAPVAGYRAAGTLILCKPYPLRAAGRFTKADFTLDLAAGGVTCPGGQTVPCRVGQTVHFPAATCQACPQRAHCTTAKAGRSLTLHAREPALLEARARVKTPAGRAALRTRTKVEHRLAHIVGRQGPRARYVGVRKNLLDLRGHAMVHNLFVAMRKAA
jgi:hypothetical protein